MSVVIRVEHLSKAYQLGQIGTGTISRDLERWWTTKVRGKDDPFLKVGEVNDRTRIGESDMVWALNDVSFEVKAGEVLGIIGRNGAGKSTLLKILSRTTSPTRGQVKIKGRIASLLEVGTGFHPELTGRENIFLNGAILGMTKREIKSKFDEIVDFSGVERYIDTPVKRYSSGMYVRLAFAVAAHLEPEILVVDEVLAVGDAEFQKKALGKMKDVSQGQGRTVLFVSHNLPSVQSLCTKCMFLKNGFVAEAPKDTEYVIDKYIRSLNVDYKSVQVSERRDREGEGLLKISAIKITDKYGIEVTNLVSGQNTLISIFIENSSTPFVDAPIEVAIAISKFGGSLVTVMSTKYLNKIIISTKKIIVVNFNMEKIPLMSGVYSINVMIRSKNEIQDWVKEAKIFEVENGDYYGTGLGAPESHNSVYFDFNVSTHEID